jgi:basic membrane lipoprotein Med (substrate-binding protein (PBP1-ABC) superfamily)
MKLSTYIQKQKDKDVPKDWALGNAKGVVKKAGDRWTKAKQRIFDTIWSTSIGVKLDINNPKHKGVLSWVKDYITARKANPKLAKQLKVNIDKAIIKEKLNSEEVYSYYGDPDKPTKLVKAQPKEKLDEQGQGGTGEQRLQFFIKLLKPCNFTKEDWSNYGLHVMKEGSDKRPTNIKLALDLLQKHGFAQQHRIPSSSEFADRNSSRAVTFYSDKYGNAANTISQKSDNGKNDFYVLNVTHKLTQNDKNKLDSITKKLDDKYKSAIDNANKGLLKKKKDKLPYQMSLKEFTKNVKGNASVRTSLKDSPEEIKDQWIQTIELAIKTGKKIDPEIQAEYTSHVKSVGALYKLPTSKSKYEPITLDEAKLKRLKRKLKSGDVTVKSDSGKVFTLTKSAMGFPCGSSLKTAMNVYPLFCVLGKLK